MIKGSFKRTGSGRIVSFELTGHAEAGPYGSDVVCAAVSALAISTVNGIDVEGGYLYVEMLTTVNQEQKNIAQILLENLLLGLQSIENENTEFIQIKTITEK